MALLSKLSMNGCHNSEKRFIVMEIERNNMYLVIKVKAKVLPNNNSEYPDYDISDAQEVLELIGNECDYNISMPANCGIEILSTEIVGYSLQKPEIP